MPPGCRRRSEAVNLSSSVRQTSAWRTPDIGWLQGVTPISRQAYAVHLTKNSQPLRPSAADGRGRAGLQARRRIRAGRRRRRATGPRGPRPTPTATSRRTADRFSGSISQTSRTPASKYSPTLRHISAGVFPSLSTSTARSGTRSGTGSLGLSPPGSLSHEMNDTSGISHESGGDLHHAVGTDADPPIIFIEKHVDPGRELQAHPRLFESHGFLHQSALDQLAEPVLLRLRQRMTSSTVAVPGAGRSQMRSSGTRPSRSQRSATVSRSGGAIVAWLMRNPRG